MGCWTGQDVRGGKKQGWVCGVRRRHKVAQKKAHKRNGNSEWTVQLEAEEAASRLGS